MRHTAQIAAALLAVCLVATACKPNQEESSDKAESAHTHEGSQEDSEQSSNAAFNIDDPNTCATCHSAVVEEWKSSMHANAHHDNDPLYGAMRDFRMEREGEELATKCSNCHSPRAPDEPDSIVAHTGVSCAGCHNIASIDRGDGSVKGASAITYEDDCRMRGPHDIESGSGAPHRTGDAAPWITDGTTLCMTCHESATTPHGLPSCTTGFEFAEGETEQTCTGCHMPVVEGPSGLVSDRPTHRSHMFVGPNQLWRDGEGAQEFMATSVNVTAAIEGDTLSATLQNQSAHSFPTGFPGRMALLKVTGFDAAGEAVWSNFGENAMEEDPDAVFNKIYVNDAGEAVMPPYGTEIRRDSRLTPGESRELTWEVPSEVAEVEFKLLFRLLPPPAAKALGLDDTELAEPRVMLTKRVTRE
jgi:hypothetical protein